MTSHINVWIVILAAGRSSRLGRPKQLLDLGGEPILARVLKTARMAEADGIVLVLGHEANAIQQRIPDLNEFVVINPDYAAGQSTSLQFGLAALPLGTHGAVVMLGDQPFVSVNVVNAVIAAFRADGRTDRIIRPRYGAKPGNPVLLGRDHFATVATITGDVGARELIRDRDDLVSFLQVEGEHPPRDVDTEADYDILLRELSDRREPT